MGRCAIGRGREIFLRAQGRWVIAVQPPDQTFPGQAAFARSRAPVKARLDAIDWKILRELQADGRITNVELASRVGISAPPCLRRVRALEEMGVIKGYRALVAGDKLGYGVTVFAMVHLASQAEADLNAFVEKVRTWPIIRECHTVSGDFDFVMKCVAPDLPSFQTFVGDLTATPNVRNVRTVLTLSQVKDAPNVPMEIAPAD
jgi:DNA-binding Lrp family transcriptional regulator